MTHQSAAASVPLSAPYYGATFPIAVKRFWQKYATSIYIPSLLAARTDGHGLQMNAGILVVIVIGGLWFLATVVPTLALLWRRLHDANLSGLYCVLGIIPTVGWLFILVFTLLPSNSAGARFDR